MNEMRGKFNALKIRKKHIQRYREKLDALEPEFVADVIKDYSKGGKDGIPTVISGFNTYEIDRLRLLYEVEISRLTELIYEVESVIAAEPDETTKMILSLRYVDGMKLQDVADTLNYSLEAVNKRISRFFAQFD